MVENLTSLLMEDKGKGIEEAPPVLRSLHNTLARGEKKYEKSRLASEVQTPGIAGIGRYRLSKNSKYFKVKKGGVISSNRLRMM